MSPLKTLILEPPGPAAQIMSGTCRRPRSDATRTPPVKRASKQKTEAAIDRVGVETLMSGPPRVARDVDVQRHAVMLEGPPARIGDSHPSIATL